MSTLCAEARETARRLLTHYVKVQGLVISQMLRKSVETRDWLSTLEPRNVRAVMKRVVEDTTAIDVQVLLSADCWSLHACRALDSSSLRAKQRGSDCILCHQNPHFIPMGLWRPRVTQKVGAGMG